MDPVNVPAKFEGRHCVNRDSEQFSKKKQ